MAIVDISYLETAQKNTFLHLLGNGLTPISEITLNQKIIDMNDEAVAYISAMILSIEDLTENQVDILKQLYITYRLYQKVEREDIAMDKKDDLDKTLDVMNNNQIKRTQNQANKNVNKKVVAFFNGVAIEVDK